jgi:hypothetical protein
MKSNKLTVILLLVAFSIIGCIPTTAYTPRPNVDPSVQPYIVTDASYFNIRDDFWAKDVRLTMHRGTRHLTVSGEFGSEFFAWNINSKGMANRIFDRIIPELVKKLGDAYRDKNFGLDFAIVVVANILTDKDKAFVEEFNRRTGRAPYTAPRSSVMVRFSVKEEIAFKYANFDIDSTALRENMEIVLNEKERIR